MRILPVIDLKHGQVVRGVAGKREQYRPIESGLVNGAEPAAVAEALKRSFDFEVVYVADLDGIAGGSPDWQSYRAIADVGLRLYIDPGLASAAEATRFLDDGKSLPVDRVIVGLESLAKPEQLETMAAVLQERALFSLDLKDGRPLNSAPAWQSHSPLEIARLARQAGFRGLIILDLADVGVGGGPSTLGLCRTIRKFGDDLQIIAGGGVRGPADLDQLAAAGCDAALVASALHDGRLTPEQVRVESRE